MDLEYSSCSEYSNDETHRDGLEVVHPEISSNIGYTPWITSYENAEYKQVVRIEILRNLHMHGRIMLTMLNAFGTIEADDTDGQIPKTHGRSLTAQDVIECVSETSLNCLDVCVDQRTVTTDDCTYRITTIGPIRVSTRWSLNKKQVSYWTHEGKFCIRCETRYYNACYEFGVSIEKLQPNRAKGF
jgi:hypothetical protein